MRATPMRLVILFAIASFGCSDPIAQSPGVSLDNPPGPPPASEQAELPNPAVAPVQEAAPSVTPLAPGQFAQVKVIDVIDGDTITVLHGSSQPRVRLHGIDAPENGQPGASGAKRALSEKLSDSFAHIDVRDTDRYGRIVADVYLQGRRINLDMVADGWAWHYREYDQSAAFSGSGSV